MRRSTSYRGLLLRAVFILTLFAAAALPALAQTGVPRAADGRSLLEEPADVQAAFMAAWGPAAAERWVAEHNAQIGGAMVMAAQQPPATPTLYPQPLLGIGATVVPTLGSTGGTGGTGRVEVQVDIRTFAYHPRRAIVPVGSTVIWRNYDYEGHTATGQGFDTGIIRPNDSGTVLMNRAGMFPYFCRLHPWMRGEVVVR
jgi:plastocyanin